jgi:hypothetical protein
VAVTEGQRRALAPYCAGCGQPEREGGHAGHLRPLDPPRFCADCGRKLAVQVLPTGYEARCVRCQP